MDDSRVNLSALNRPVKEASTLSPEKKGSTQRCFALSRLIHVEAVGLQATRDVRCVKLSEKTPDNRFRFASGNQCARYSLINVLAIPFIILDF